MAQPIILDCDPGHDDAIALVLALASPELDVKAVTSSAGNQTPDKTLRNVLRMLTLLKRTDIPVAGGAVKPLMRELIIADNVHGESGLDGPELPEPGFAPQGCTAVELMAKVLRESAEPVTLVATGPQTNVALLLNSHPELHGKIARIVIMGGAMGLGNWTRSNSEICLLATKGKPKRISGSVRSIVLSPLQQHSRKPAEIRDRIVELMGDLPRIELFAREAAPGWDVWGNEAPTPEVNDAPVDSVELAGKEETHEPDNQRDPAPQL